MPDIFSHIQKRYPRGLRKDAEQLNDSTDTLEADEYGDFPLDFSEYSLTYKYDLLRTFVYETFSFRMRIAALGLFVQTAGEDAIAEWEDFLQISVDTSLSIWKRRGNIQAKIAGVAATKAVIREIVLGLVGGDGSNIAFYERYNESSPTELDLWTYEIRITKPTTNAFSVSELFEKVTKVQPAHVNLVLIIESSTSDTMQMSDSFQSGVNYTGRWCNPDGTPDGTMWGSPSTPLTNFVWKS